MDIKCPRPVTEADREAFERVLSIPWMKECVQQTGEWGRRIADVEIIDLPPNMAANVLLVPSDSADPYSIPKTDVVQMTMFRWDVKAHDGWTDFPLTLRFADGAENVIQVPSSAKLKDGHSMLIDVTSPVQEVQYQAGRQIPRIVFNMSPPLSKRRDDIRRYLVRRRNITKLLQPRAMFIVLEDQHMDRLVAEDSEIPNFLEAYNALIPMSYKADLLRYYLLYKFGGIYYDDKSIMLRSMDSPAFNSILGGEGSGEGRCDMFISCEGKRHEIAFIGARQGSPVMRAALERSIDNVMKRYYGIDRLSITGNLMMNEILEENGRVDLPLIQDTNYAKLLNIEWEKAFGEVIAPLLIDENLQRIKVGEGCRNIPGDKIVSALKLDPPVATATLKKLSGGSNLSLLWDRQIAWIKWPQATNYYNSAWKWRGVYVNGNPPFWSLEMKLAVVTVVITVLCAVGYAVSFVRPEHF